MGCQGQAALLRCLAVENGGKNERGMFGGEYIAEKRLPFFFFLNTGDTGSCLNANEKELIGKETWKYKRQRE